LTQGCYAAGLPIAPISPADSWISSDQAKLKHCAAVLRPRVAFAQSGELFAHAFKTLREMSPDLVVVTAEGRSDSVIALSALMATVATPAVNAARDAGAPRRAGAVSLCQRA